MTRDGELLCNRRGGYGPARRMDLLAGRVVAHADGFGFLQPEEGGEDLFLPVPEMRSVMHGDRVLARVAGADRNGRPRGLLVEVLERAHCGLVGRYLEKSGVGLVIPDNPRLKDVVIPRAKRGGAAHGDYVAVTITRQPETHLPPLGHVTEVLSGDNPHRLAMAVLIRSLELPDRWTSEVEEEVAALPTEVEAGQLGGREDLRALDLVTIDGEDARDFDDAVHAERDAHGWRLLVAIADVSHYVQPGSAIDREAERRGTSVYLPRRVLPMLPELLSNHLCSLRPREDRLCMACELRFDPAGEPRPEATRVFPAVMRSAARLTYNEVAAAMEEGDAGSRRRHGALLERLQALYDLYACLHARRRRRGVLDFDSREMHFDFDANERLCALRPAVRHNAHRLIEELMLAANVAVAETLLARDTPTLFRVHAAPTAERLEELRAFLGKQGLALSGGEAPVTADYARLLQAAAKRALAPRIQMMVLRSLPLAVYAPANKGHFGLGFDAYLHFTSPIRRYPDLLVHRAVRRLPRGGVAPATLARLGQHCSDTERRAEEAERAMQRWCKCDYLRDRIGDTFTGVITGVCSFGVFCELEGIGMDGLVHVTALPGDYYHHDAVAQSLVGENTGVGYGLADRLQVRLVRVDMDNRRLDLDLA